MAPPCSTIIWEPSSSCRMASLTRRCPTRRSTTTAHATVAQIFKPFGRFALIVVAISGLVETGVGTVSGVTAFTSTPLATNSPKNNRMPTKSVSTCSGSPWRAATKGRRGFADGVWSAEHLNRRLSANKWVTSGWSSEVRRPLVTMIAADNSLSNLSIPPSGASPQSSSPSTAAPPAAVKDMTVRGNKSAVAGGVAGANNEKGARGSADAVVVGDETAQRLRVTMFFFFWYMFNVGYNLSTKYTLNAMPLPVSLAAIQLLVGVPYVWGIWLTGIRKPPRIGPSQVRGAVPVAAAHTTAHLAAVVSLGAGAVGFVQVVKGAEPLFTAFLSFFTGSAMPWPVYLTLLPVIGGVAMASVGEISFSLVAFGAAMTSNASAASRSVLGKKFLASTNKEDRMDAGNLYAVMTMLGCLVLTPMAFVMEGPRVASVWSAALNAGRTPAGLIKNGLLSGLFFYLYNEVSFYALNAIHPVTHALGNTLKRVVMIVVSVVVLNHQFTPLGLVGCCTALSGVMGYSVLKAKLQSKMNVKSKTSGASDATVVTNSGSDAIVKKNTSE